MLSGAAAYVASLPKWKRFARLPSMLHNQPFAMQVRVANYMRHMTRDDTDGNFQVGSMSLLHCRCL